MPGPLEGIKVVEIGVWVAGPAAGGVLADWGAEVIKIEPPEGDPARTFQKMLGGDMPTNPVFELDNRGKRSVVIDLRTDEGRELAYQLIDEADVFLTNVRLKGLDRLGLDQETLRARNPRLIYAAITGYGVEGPDSDRAAYDVAAFWARSGIANLLTPPDGSPPFQRGGMGDHNTGLTGAGMISAALFARERTGQGQFVSTSLLRQGAYTIGFDLSIQLGWGMTLAVGRRETMGNVAINNYQAGDGRRFWIVGLEGARHWPPLARAVGRPEWIEDERFVDPASRFANATELIGLLDEIFATKSLEEWAAIFDEEPDFFWAPLQTPEELLADPQFLASGGLIEVPDGSTTTTMLATPVDFHDMPGQVRSMAPAIGEHTREVLANLGLSDAAIDQHITQGTVASQ